MFVLVLAVVVVVVAVVAVVVDVIFIFFWQASRLLLQAAVARPGVSASSSAVLLFLPDSPTHPGISTHTVCNVSGLSVGTQR